MQLRGVRQTALRWRHNQTSKNPLRNRVYFVQKFPANMWPKTFIPDNSIVHSTTARHHKLEITHYIFWKVVTNFDNTLRDGWLCQNGWNSKRPWPPTVGENREFWLLKTSLIFQVISWDLDIDFSKHITLKIQWQIKRYFKFVLWVIYTYSIGHKITTGLHNDL